MGLFTLQLNELIALQAWDNTSSGGTPGGTYTPSGDETATYTSATSTMPTTIDAFGTVTNSTQPAEFQNPKTGAWVTGTATTRNGMAGYSAPLTGVDAKVYPAGTLKMRIVGFSTVYYNQVAVTVTGTSGGGTPTSVNMFTMRGSQSNGGTSRIARLLDSPTLAPKNLVRTYPNFFIYNATTTQWEPMVVGGKSAGGNNSGYTALIDDLENLGFGFEVAVADELSKTKPGVNYYLFKYFVGGTRIEQWMSGGNLRPELDKRFSDSLAALTAINKTPNFLANYWNQGEGNFDTPQATYLSYLNSYFDSLYPSGFPAGARNVLALYNPQSNPNNVGVRPAQLQYVAAHSYGRAIYTDNYTYMTNTDDLPHYTAESMYQNGLDFLGAVARTTNAPPTNRIVVNSLAATQGDFVIEDEYTSAPGTHSYNQALAVFNIYLPANTPGTLYFTDEGQATHGAMVLLNTTPALTTFGSSFAAIQINRADGSALRCYGATVQSAQNDDPSQIGWQYGYERASDMTVYVVRSKDSGSTFERVNSYGVESRALYSGGDYQGGCLVRLTQTGWLPGVTPTASTPFGPLYSFRASQGVAADASTWTSTGGTGALVLSQSDATKRATFDANGATVNGGQVYQSNAPALASLRKMAYVWKGSMANTSGYPAPFAQNQAVPGALEPYWGVAEGKLFMQLCCSSGGNPDTNYATYAAPYSGGALDLYIGIDLDATTPVTMLVNGTAATRLVGQEGTPVTFCNEPFFVFADSLAAGNAQVGTLNRFLVFNQLLTASQRTTYFA